MADIIKKGLLTAIGTASIAVEKANKILSDIKKKRLISTKDAKNLIKRLVAEAERERKRINVIISEELRKQAKKAKPVVREGKIAAKRAFSNTKKKAEKTGRKVKKAQRTAEKRGKGVVRKAAQRLR